MTGEPLNIYEHAIVRNADWFIGRQSREGYIDADGDEFYGIRGDATLVGHSVTVRCYAHALTGSEQYLDSARRSLAWLAARQDAAGGWRGFSAFTLDGAQCVFDGFNTYQWISGDRQYEPVLVKAADRMVTGTVQNDGTLRLADIIEVGEYAHFALLAWKTTGEQRFMTAAKQMLAHIEESFDEAEGCWRPFATSKLRHDLLARLVRPPLRLALFYLPVRGRLAARVADRILPLVVADSHPQYAMSLMDTEALLDTLDGACDFPHLREQTRAAITWAETRCRGPFAGSLVESIATDRRSSVYPLAIINDARKAALWPSTCLLIAYCGMNEAAYRDKARAVADWILGVQDERGGFSNFTEPDGAALPLQSGNVNFYAAMALWLFNEVYNNGRVRLFTRPHTSSAHP